MSMNVPAECRILVLFSGCDSQGGTVFICINIPGAMHFSKGGGGYYNSITDKKFNSQVQWQWAIMDTYSLDLACRHV